jgi:transmembrane sensor
MPTIPTELIAKYLSHQATPKDEEQLLTWVSESFENQIIFQQFSEAWNVRHSPKDLPDTEQALARLHKRISGIETKHVKLRNRTWFRVAASFAAIVVTTFLVMRSWNDASPRMLTMAPDTLQTVVLPDSSMVTLAPGATLSFPEEFRGDERRVVLTGKAFFDVAKNASMPFLIQSGTVTTKVLGTSFTIDHRSQQFKLTVNTGRVQVGRKEDIALLVPGDRLVYDTISRAHLIERVNMADATDWMYGVVRLEDATLSQVVAKLNDYFNRNIILVNESQMGCRITGTFEQQEIESIVEAIEFSTGLAIEANGDAWTVSGKCK